MPKENQRVTISKCLLKEGIMKLLNKKHINDISVSELCKLSGINRTTFYRHYQTPHDILLEIEMDFVERCHEASGASNVTKDLNQYITHMCNYIYENRTIGKLFIKNNTDRDMILIFQNFTNSFLASRKVFYKGHSVSSDSFQLMQTFFAYGVYALVRQWISEDIPLAAEEVADLIIGSFNHDFSFE